MAMVKLNTIIISNSNIQIVRLISLKYGDINILQEPIIMSKYDNLYFVYVNIPDEYMNKELMYEIEVIDKLPKEIYEWMPESLVLYNKYVVSGNIFLYSPQFRDYKYVKRMLVTLTGRYELVNNPKQDDYSDPTGQLNFLFNSAQRWLDEKADITKFIGFLYKELPAGQDWISFNGVRYIRRIYEIGDNKEVKSIPFLIMASSMVPEQLGNTLTQQQKDELGLPNDMYNTEHYPTKIVYVKPEDKNRKILIECYYYSQPLERDSDISFWTVQAPELLVKTAYMKMNEFYNNIEHANYLRQDIISSLIELRNNYTAEMWESIPYHNMKMEGEPIWQ